MGIVVQGYTRKFFQQILPSERPLTYLNLILLNTEIEY